MAAGLGFKDFVTGEVLTAADVDGYLMQGVWVFASAAARTSAVASPQEGNMSYLKDTNSLEYYSGSAWTAVSGGAQKVVQIVSAKYSTDTSTTSSTFSDTGLTATITPTSASNKVLVFLNMAGVAKAVSDTSVNIRLVRDSTTISANFSNGGTGSSAANFIGGVSTSILDTPATTSATIYKATFASSNNTGNAYVQLNASESTITLMEVTP